MTKEAHAAAGDELLADEIERALEPYREALRPDELEDLREVMMDVLATHPVAVRAFGALGPAPQVASSGEVDVEGTPASSEADSRKSSSRGRP